MSTTTTPPRNDHLPPVDGPGPPDAPAPGGRMRWYRRGWVIALGALLVGVGVGSALGSTKTAPRAATVTAPAKTVVHNVPGRTKTTKVVHVRNVPGPTKTVTQTVTQTVNASAPAPSSPSGGSGAGGQSFSGNGGKNLGTITIAADSTLTWTNDGPVFTVTDASTGVYVDSQAHSGTTAVSAGTYTNVGVNALGNWTIAISPG